MYSSNAETFTFSLKVYFRENSVEFAYLILVSVLLIQVNHVIFQFSMPVHNIEIGTSNFSVYNQDS